MPGRGFLIRGTLQPSMGSGTVSTNGVLGVVKSTPKIPVSVGRPIPRPPNRIPPSISLKQGSGKRG